MRRIVCALAPLIGVLLSSATAQAWVPTATYDVPGGGAAACLRDAGSGQVTLLGAYDATATAIDVLRPDGATFTPVGSTTLGRLAACPGVGTGSGTPMASDVYLGSDGRTIHSAQRAATLGGAPQDLADTSDISTYGPSVASNAAGATVVAWPQLAGEFSADAEMTIRVALRPAGATAFLPAQSVATNGSSFSHVVKAGIDDAGRATVAWITQGGLPGGQVMVATSDPAGHFGVPQVLGLAGTGALALAVAPNGGALIASLSIRGLDVAERAPGSEAFTRISPPPAKSAFVVFGAFNDLSVSLDAAGNSVLAAGGAAGLVVASVRSAGGTFRAWTALAVPPKSSSTGSGAFLSSPNVIRVSTGFNADQAQPPFDDERPGVTSAIAPDGSVVVAWTATDAAGLTTARAANGSIANGLGPGGRLSGLCAQAVGAQALVLPDGGVAVAWTDNTTTRTVVLDEDPPPPSGGRLHLSRPGVAPAATAPRPSVSIVNRRPLRIGDPLRLRARCAGGPCDLRVSAPVLTNESPWVKEQRPAGPLRNIFRGALSVGTRSIGADQSAEVVLKAPFPLSFVRPLTRTRTRITATACGPDGASRRVTLRPVLQGGRYRPRARIVAATATQHGRSIRVTVRLDRADYNGVSVRTLPLSPQAGGFGTGGRGRRVVHLTVPTPSSKRVRAVQVEVDTKDLLTADRRRIVVR